MRKHTHTHYYVQVLTEDGALQIVYHHHDEAKNEYYHKFVDKKKAKALAEAEKKITPADKFRVIKCTESYDAGEWI